MLIFVKNKLGIFFLIFVCDKSALIIVFLIIVQVADEKFFNILKRFVFSLGHAREKVESSD